MAQQQGDGWIVLFTWSIFFFGSIILNAPGTEAFKFIGKLDQFASAYLGFSMDFNCTTDDPTASIALLHNQQGSGTLTERPPTPDKLILDGQVFTVLNIAVSDAGQYACRATNRSGTTITSSRLFRVLQRAQLPRNFGLVPNKALIMTQGQSQSIICQAREEPFPFDLTWEKRTSAGSYASVDPSMVKRDRSNQMVREILTIANAKLSDDGLYKCTVSVKHKSTFRLTSVDVRVPSAPTIAKPTTRDRVVVEGQEQTLQCDAEGAPKPVVTWYKNGRQLKKTQCTKDPGSCQDVVYEVFEVGDASPVLTEGRLKIVSALYPRDDGEFKCVASNRNSPTAELIFNLNVTVKPHLRKELDDKVRYVNENLKTKVSCKVARSNPLPTFRWFYQNFICDKSSVQECVPDEGKWKPVPPEKISPNASVPSSKSSVNIDSDQGNSYYQCKASNSLGNDSLVIIFKRAASEKPKVEMDRTRTKTEYDEKSKLEIYCFDRCGGICGNYFSKDGKFLSPAADPRVNITFDYDEFGGQKGVLLTLTNMTLNDSGQYECGLLAPRYSDRINITVKELSVPVISGLRDQTVVQKDNGDHVRLTCNVIGHPSPTISWFFTRNDRSTSREELHVTSDLGGDDRNCRSRKSGLYFLKQNGHSLLIICHPNYEMHQGKYSCQAKNFLGKDEKSAVVNIEMEPIITKPDGSSPSPLKLGETLNLTCEAKGNPAPNVTWKKNHTGVIVGASQLNINRLILKLEKDEDFGIYMCIAQNRLNTASLPVSVKKEPEIPISQFGKLSTTAIVGISIGVGLFVFIILVVCCCLYQRQKRQIDEYKQLHFLQQSDYQIDRDRSLLEQCNDLPYDPDWEFPEERLILGKVLGSGAFGQVVEAEAIGILALNPRDKSAESFKRRSKIRRSSKAKDLKKEESTVGWKNMKIPVAVKTLKEGATREEYKDLASELKILIHLGQHKNIVNLLGACTRGKRLMVIMEFAPNGSLLSFLRGKRETYNASWIKTTNDPEKEFTLVDLVMIGFQVARGMSFLASRKCVHRDLAARNILVGEDYVMKIADFGLARDIYKDDLYVKKTQGLLPVKWMAPESLFDRIYTEKTDVWSFGVLLWETFTLGGTPYPGLPTEQLLDYLSDGKRMEMPAKCPLEVYTIMRDCWINEPDQRPQFRTLTERLVNILEKNTSKENPYLALQMEEEAPQPSGYYMQPIDGGGGIRDSNRYVQSPVHSPTSDNNEPPNYEDATNDPNGYNSPLPNLPPSLPTMSDDEIPADPLPPLPAQYLNTRSNSAGGESGIDIGAEDDGYIDDADIDTPFLLREKPVSIEMDNVKKVPEAKVLMKGSHQKYETQL
ncbi:fibroblast growth factor receptor 3-like [Acropora palmata]|uniref:fibroblast growth factor receptor 3-like n=1 Tax=Acropora palmata TaxID=6131 RepID=UPI003D9FD359